MQALVFPTDSLLYVFPTSGSPCEYFPNLSSLTITPVPRNSQELSRNLPLSPKAHLVPFKDSPYFLLFSEPLSPACLRAEPPLLQAVGSPDFVSCHGGLPTSAHAVGPPRSWQAGLFLPCLIPCCPRPMPSAQAPHHEGLTTDSSLKAVSPCDKRDRPPWRLSCGPGAWWPAGGRLHLTWFPLPLRAAGPKWGDVPRSYRCPPLRVRTLWARCSAWCRRASWGSGEEPLQAAALLTGFGTRNCIVRPGDLLTSPFESRDTVVVLADGGSIREVGALVFCCLGLSRGAPDSLSPAVLRRGGTSISELALVPEGASDMTVFGEDDPRLRGAQPRLHVSTSQGANGPALTRSSHGGWEGPTDTG